MFRLGFIVSSFVVLCAVAGFTHAREAPTTREGGTANAETLDALLVVEFSDRLTEAERAGLAGEIARAFAAAREDLRVEVMVFGVADGPVRFAATTPAAEIPRLLAELEPVNKVSPGAALRAALASKPELLWFCVSEPLAQDVDVLLSPAEQELLGEKTIVHTILSDDDSRHCEVLRDLADRSGGTYRRIDPTKNG